MGDRNNNCPKNIASSEVQDFYKDGTVLITGGTGFVGKALLEKLLRSCPDLSTVYVLIRTKQGLDPETRLRELLKSTVFDMLRAEDEASGKGVLKKVTVVPGNVTEPALGLSSADYNRLSAEVTVVFHSAATVSFNETLKNAIELNTMATQRVVDFCRDIRNLKALVHISTAYSNADMPVIDETVYKPPANPSTMIDICQNLDDNVIEEFSSILTKHVNHPNTYTLTKTMAEWIVNENADTYAAAIVRPSIITGAWREPMPGWVDNIGGITGVIMEIGRGTLRSIICDDQLVVDIVPVDIVVNTLITAAWHTYKFRSNCVRVYNCTSGSLNTIYWRELAKLTRKHSMKFPSKYIQWYPGFSLRTNYFVHWIVSLLGHILPALIGDSILRLQGSKPIMMRICNKIRRTALHGEFFALNQWEFKCENQKSLTTDLSKLDNTLFPSDVALVNWDDYVEKFMVGIRMYVLRDPMDSLPAARKKLQRFYILHRCGQAVAAFMLLKFIGWR